MSPVSIFCIGLSAILLFAGAIIIFVSWRGSCSRQTSDSDRDRAVIDDRGDRVIWEMSQGFPLVDKEADGKTLPRRMFFSRAALAIAGTFLSWRMARGSTDTQLLKKIAGTDKPEAPNPLNRAESIAPKTSTGTEKEMALLQDQSHGDSHNDFVIHGDNMMPDHYDVNARNGHVDMDQHVDTNGHVDVHSDSSN